MIEPGDTPGSEGQCAGVPNDAISSKSIAADELRTAARTIGMWNPAVNARLAVRLG